MASNEDDELPASDGCSLRREVISELLLSLKRCRLEKSRVQRKHQDLEIRLEQMERDARDQQLLLQSEPAPNPPISPPNSTQIPEVSSQSQSAEVAISEQKQQQDAAVQTQNGESLLAANEQEPPRESESDISNETSQSIRAWIDQIELATCDLGLTPREALFFAEDVSIPLVSRWMLRQDRFSSWTDLRDSLMKALGSDRESVKSVSLPPSESSVEILDRLGGGVEKIELGHLGEQEDQIFLEDDILDNIRNEMETRPVSSASIQQSTKIAISTGSSPDCSQRVSTPPSTKKEEILAKKVVSHNSPVDASSHGRISTQGKVVQKSSKNIPKPAFAGSKPSPNNAFVDSMGRITPKKLKLTQSTNSEIISAQDLLKLLRSDFQITHKNVTVENHRIKAAVYTQWFNSKVNLLRLDFLKRLSMEWRNLPVFKELEIALKKQQIWTMQKKICLRVSIDNFDYEIDFVIVPTKDMDEVAVLEDPLSRLDEEDAGSKEAAAAFDERFNIKGKGGDLWW